VPGSWARPHRAAFGIEDSSSTGRYPSTMSREPRSRPPPIARNPMFAAAHKIGRLVEAWAIQFNTVDDVVMFGLQSSRAITEVPGPILICSDYSNLQALPSDVFSAFVEVLRRANPRLDRAALIMPRKGSSLRPQMEALLERAPHPNRRLCADQAEARAWLSSLLNREEQMRLDQFLRERAQLDPAIVADIRRAAPVVRAARPSSRPPTSRRSPRTP
jgi:hypothetical protein